MWISDCEESALVGLDVKLEGAPPPECILNREPTSDEARFRYVVLLDDFSASGLSYIRKDEEPGEWAGKIPKIVDDLTRDDGLGQCIADDNVRVLVVL